MQVSRYESDRNWKEKLELEKQKLKALSWPKRFEYLWTYYKWHGVLAIAIGCFIYVVGLLLYNTQFDTVFSAVIVNAGAGEEILAEDFKEYCEDTEKFNKYVFNTRLRLTDDNAKDQDALGMLLGIVAGKDADVMILPKYQLDRYAQQGVFQTLDKVLSEEQMEFFGEAVGTYGIHIPNNEKLAKFGAYPGEDAYLCVLCYVEDFTYVEKFIEYLTEE